MSHILAEQPHLGIAIFNNNSVGTLAGLTRRITLLHVLDERQKLMLVPLEIQISSQQQVSGSLMRAEMRLLGEDMRHELENVELHRPLV